MAAAPDSGSQCEWVVLLDVVQQPTQHPWDIFIPQKHNWFAVEYSLNADAYADDGKQKDVKSIELNCPIRGMSIILPPNAAALPVNSTIYVIGGGNDEILSKQVWVTSVSKSGGSSPSPSPSIVCKRRWSNCKGLKHQRAVMGSCAVIQDGITNKIFVFGGIWSSISPWEPKNPLYYAEVYDLHKRKWSLVEGLPMRDEWINCDVPITAVVELPRRNRRRATSTIILLYIPDMKALYYYDPRLNTSDVFDPDFATEEGLNFLTQIVPVTVAPAHSKKPTTLLYCVQSMPEFCLRVYNLATKTWLGTLSGFESHHLPDYSVLDDPPIVHLVPLGSCGSLCALWEGGWDYTSKPLRVRCVKFSIKDGQPLTAVIESCTDYAIPGGWYLSQCVPIKVKAEASEMGG